MKLLTEKIISDGVAIGTEIVKVDSFLNHQIDINLIDQIGKEFFERYKNSGITKILTIEASGIAVASLTARYFDVPVVFAKKSEPSTMVDDKYTSLVKSFTKNKVSMVFVSKRYISKNDTVLIIDDFLAHGEALRGLIDIVNQADAKLAGAGIVIEKRFQNGGKPLREKGIRIESLAVIESIKDGKINFI